MAFSEMREMSAVFIDFDVRGVMFKYFGHPPIRSLA